ncbi:hypothetical protein Tco_0574881, partial [Tanacetum coccineum]
EVLPSHSYYRLRPPVASYPWHGNLFALRAAIGKAIEKGMQDGLSAGIVHGKEGRVLTDVAAHNPFAEVDYTYALQQIRS